MDYGALPPEINSARMYAGPGAGSMLAAAAAWDGLSAELQSAASSYGSVISALTSGPWVGPSSTAMAAAAAPYVAWMNATAGQAELAAAQAQAAAGAYSAAFVATVPPPEIAANRAQLMSLVATNLFGQNNPAIATTEALYGEMWAQDAAAMYNYAATSAATTAKVTPFTAAPETTNAAGLAAQAAAGAQTAGASTGAGVQSTLSQLISSVQTALQSLTSPSSSTSGLSGILSSLLGGSSSGSSGSGIPFLGGSSGSGLEGIMQGAISSYAVIPGWFGMMVGEGALGPLMATPIGKAFDAPAAAAAADAAAPAAAEAADAALGPAADLGGLAGVGEAAAVGGLSVPPNWGWAASGLSSMLGGVPLTLPAISLGEAGGLPLAAGLPLMMGGLPREAAAGAVGAAAGAAGAKYLPRLSVVGRSPAAGYSAESPSKPTPAYPIPAGFPTNGHAPPGYQPAIVYLPTNGHAPANK